MEGTLFNIFAGLTVLSALLVVANPFSRNPVIRNAAMQQCSNVVIPRHSKFMISQSRNASMSVTVQRQPGDPKCSDAAMQ